jgi:hypothetical protein
MPQTLDNLTYTWNSSGTTFTGIKYNVTDTASAAGSLLMDLQVGGSSRFRVNKNGNIFFGPAASDNLITTSNNLTFVIASVYRTFSVYTGSAQLAADAEFGWTTTNNNSGTTLDLRLWRDAANTLAQRNGIAAQTFRLYNTFTDASNGEWFETTWSAQANTIVLRANNNGTGTLRNLHLRAYAMQIWGATTYFVTDTGVVSVAVAPQSAGVAALVDPSGSDFNRLQFGGTTSSFPALKRSSAALVVRLADDSANAALESASLKTNAPAGGTSGTWKLGVAATVSPTSPNRTIEVDIGGTIYYIAAKTTND